MRSRGKLSDPCAGEGHVHLRRYGLGCDERGLPHPVVFECTDTGRRWELSLFVGGGWGRLY